MCVSAVSTKQSACAPCARITSPTLWNLGGRLAGICHPSLPHSDSPVDSSRPSLTSLSSSGESLHFQEIRAYGIEVPDPSPDEPVTKTRCT